ncbi:acetate--CoA ligase family protein [Chloroflexota bacterium]
MNKPTLEFLFNPSSVAIVGASKDLRKSGGRFLKSFINHGFKGQLFPVNPNETEIMGMKVYSTVRDIAANLDLVMMTIPASETPQVMTECAAKGVKFAVMYTAGFREISTEGRELEAKVLEIARRGGVRIVGPNCMGVYCPYAGINTVVADASLPRESGSMAFVSQSGWASEKMIVSGTDRGLRFSKVISSGNQIDLTTIDYMEYFGQDPKTKFIGAYIEGITDGRRFMELARNIPHQKPIVVWKAGRTATGARASLSHTGSLAGNDAICDAAFKQSGIIRANSLDEVIDIAVTFNTPYMPSGNRIGIIEQTGGGGIAFADACGDVGLELPEFPQEIQRALRNCLKGLAAPFSTVRNPVDVVSLPRTEYAHMLPQCLTVMARAVDALLLFTYLPLTDDTLARCIDRVRDRLQKPIFVVPPYPSRETNGSSLYTQRGIPALTSPERAARAISALVQYTRYLKMAKLAR